MRIQKLFHAALLVVPLVATSSVLAQEGAAEQKRSPLDATTWGVVYDVPATAQVKVTRNVSYLSDAKGTQVIDIYSPPDLKAGEKRPAVVFLNAVGGQNVKDWGIYKTWPRLVAAHGLIGVSMNADGARIQDCLRAVFDFLTSQGGAHGIDGTRLGLYAASANVTGTMQYLSSETAAKNIRAAALYYGGVPTGTLRSDLPVLFIVAAGDAPRMGPGLNTLWQRVVEKGAPWTLLYARELPHAFDAFSDNDASRRVVQQSIAFWKSHLDPVPQPPWQKSVARDILAASYGQDHQLVVNLLAEWIKQNPRDYQAYLMNGRSLQQLRRFEEAGASYEKAQSLGADAGGVLMSLGQLRVAERRFEDATQFFTRAITAGQSGSFVYSQLARAQLEVGRNEEAVQNYEKAIAEGIPQWGRALAYYNLACGYARLGQKEKALEALSNAVNSGYTDRNQFETDPDLASVRSESRFKDILARLPKT
ncbi:MAG TPA: tetratricopeptide repeat protein [Pyrinomonadaceae bacterium]|nr:tetratricopeptide repeat protein [Pyrinomonadaceae bacterium]